ncbi:Putative mycofactocin biosynthesis glycosyltransferase MftF [bacterium HR31]|nr:Putative mycofactocin biosynthesis glycosyltransferase MftF [bacterium HR31]
MSDTVVVVPVYNGRLTLPDCLRALFRQSRPPRAVYVVDNGSTDGTYEWAKRLSEGEARLRVLREVRRGPGAARNAGVRAALQELGPAFVAFTDADCVAEEGWLEELRQGFADDRIGAVTGHIRASVSDSVVGRYLAVSAVDPGAGDRVASSVALDEGIAGGNACVRAQALQEVGLFDESFYVAQDWDLGLRLLRAGWWLRYTAGAVVHHLHRERSVGDLLRLATKYARGRPAILRRHFRGQIFVSALGRRVVTSGPITASVQLTSPEKVVLALFAAGLRWGWAWLLLPAYVAYLGARIWRLGGRSGGQPPRASELPLMVALQILESAAFNGQTLVESLRRRVVCL